MSIVGNRCTTAIAITGVAAIILGISACSGQGVAGLGSSSPSQMSGAARPIGRAAIVKHAAPNTAIQLVPGTTVGQAVFPEGDTATGGQGQQVNGINCKMALDNAFHHHAHLSLFVNGVQYAIPRGTGMKNPGKNNFIYHADCYYWIHTHDDTGILHMEPPAAFNFSLKQYFHIWGEPLSTTGVAGYNGLVTVFVNSIQVFVDPNTIVLNPFDQVTLEVGLPVVTPPVYIFPPGYP